MEDTTKETVSTHSASKAKVRARAKANETVTIVDRPGIAQESAPPHSQKGKSKGK